jgi:hypothetical protein
MNMNPNDPRRPQPDDMKKKPMPDQMGQKAQRKEDATDLEKNKSNDMKKDQTADRGQDSQRKH